MNTNSSKYLSILLNYIFQTYNDPANPCGESPHKLCSVDLSYNNDKDEKYKNLRLEENCIRTFVNFSIFTTHEEPHSPYLGTILIRERTPKKKNI